MTVKKTFTSRKCRSISLIHFKGNVRSEQGTAKKASSSKWVNSGFLNDALLHTLPLDGTFVLIRDVKSSWLPCWGDHISNSFSSRINTHLLAKPQNIGTDLGARREAFSQKGEKRNRPTLWVMLIVEECGGVQIAGAPVGEKHAQCSSVETGEKPKVHFCRQKIRSVLNSVYAETDYVLLHYLFRDHLLWLDTGDTL